MLLLCFIKLLHDISYITFLILLILRVDSSLSLRWLLAYHDFDDSIFLSLFPAFCLRRRFRTYTTFFTLSY